MASLLPVSWFNLLFTIFPLAFAIAIVRELLLVRRLRSVGIEIVGLYASRLNEPVVSREKRIFTT
jgi:hypothetical protein